MKIGNLIILLLVTLVSCNFNGSRNENAEQKLIDADRQFSEYSATYGPGKAFIDFADSAAVLLKPDMMPLKGGLSIRNYYMRMSSTRMNLTWVPLDAVVAESNDLGYTYGIWELTLNDSLRKGTYVTVWKKNKSGEWRYVLDSGNEGLGFSFKEDEE